MATRRLWKMKGLQAIVLAVASAVMLAEAQAPSRTATRTELMVVTGSESWTYYSIGRDVRRLLDD
jgi:hypothetical protein